MDEAKKQVGLADRIVVTKSDLADAAKTGDLIEHLGALNAAPVGVAIEGEIEPSFLLAEAPSPRHSFDLGGTEHSHGLCSFALIFEKPLPWAAFEQTMAVLTALRGPDLLPRQGPGRNRGMPRAGRRAFRPACRSPTGRARGLAGRRPAIPAGICDPWPATGDCREALY